MTDAFLTATSADSGLVEQHLRILSDLVRRHGVQSFLTDDTRSQWQKITTHLASSNDVRQAGFASEALGAIGRSGDAKTLIGVLQSNADADPVLRHQVVMGLVHLQRRSAQALQTFVKHPAASVRKAMVLAFNRTNNVRVLTELLNDTDADVATEAARALTDERTGHAEQELVSLLNTGSLSNAMQRRCMEAAYRVGDSISAAAVAQVAASQNYDGSLRTIAAMMLKTWNTPKQTNTVNGRWRPLRRRETPGLADAVYPHLAGMLAGPADVRTTAIELTAQLGMRNITPALESILNDANTDDNIRVTAFRALAGLGSNIDELIANGRVDRSEAVRLTSLEFLATRDPAAAVPDLYAVVKSNRIAPQQTAIRLLGEIKTAESTETLLNLFESLNQNALPKAVTLDLLRAATINAGGTLPQLVESYRTKQMSVGTKIAEWDECLEGGNVDRGRQLFFEGTAASCRRCHKIGGNGTDVGPDLSTIGQDRNRSYLLEALIDPNAKIAKGFETTIIVDTDGRIHSGIIKKENDTNVHLVTPQATLITVAKKDIDERVRGQSGMPADTVKDLSREQVRDLVEFLSSLKPDNH